MDKNIEIAIIGGGIAGFSAGIHLKNLGFQNITIYERDDSFNRRRQGYGLTMLQGIAALKKLGPKVFEEVKDLDTPSRSHYIFNSNGDILNFFGTIFWTNENENENSSPVETKGTNKKYNLHISRQNLRNILYKEFTRLNSAERINWNMKLMSIKTDNQRHLLEFSGDSDGSDVIRIGADLIVGCDGINSQVRSFKYDESQDVPLTYLGIILVLGITRSMHPLAHKRVFQTMDGTTRLFAMPFKCTDPNQNVMWQLSFPAPESTAKELAKNQSLLKETVLERCGNWHEPVASMIKGTDLDLLMGIPAYDRDPVQPDSSKSDSITLLGDAAHPMSPFKGQGANQALLDSVSFAQCLSSSSSICEGISKFEKEMYHRVRPKAISSRERVTLFHEPNILQLSAARFRGLPQTFLQQITEKKINSSTGENIENEILAEMKRLKFL